MHAVSTSFVLIAEKYDPIVELLLMAKKKLGPLMFDTLYNLGQDEEWQETLRSDLVRTLHKEKEAKEQAQDEMDSDDHFEV